MLNSTNDLVHQIVGEVVARVTEKAAAGQLLPMPEYLTSAQAAAFLGMTPNGLETMRKEGRGPRYVRASGKLVRYRVADLRAFMDAHLVDPTGGDA